MNKRLSNVYWVNSQKIDRSDRKRRRQYAIVRDNGKNVGVSKIRGFNGNKKNDERLVLSGADERLRSVYLFLTKEVLYRLSYISIFNFLG